MTIRDVTPKVSGFPGLPPWLDGPYCKRLAEECGMTPREVKEYLFKNNGTEPKHRGENFGHTENECRKDTCIPINRKSLQTSPKDVG